MFLVQHKKYNATIYAIEPAVEVATRTLQVIADNLDGKLLPGTFANVDPPDVIKERL
jgi:membrane fusion protein (multidrug efflux system)